MLMSTQGMCECVYHDIGVPKVVVSSLQLRQKGDDTRSWTHDQVWRCPCNTNTVILLGWLVSLGLHNI